MKTCQKFFTEKEDFLSIIKTFLPDVTNDRMNHIKTGWTNIVISADSNNSTYFFRFPRNNFFSKMMVKDYSFCSFIKDKVSFKLPDMQLLMDKDRPFSMHKKIKGWSLTERLKHLSKQTMGALAYDISLFIKQLNSIKPNELPQNCNMHVSDFLDELSKVDSNYYDLSKHNQLRAIEKDNHVVHGDMNPGNILLDENDKMVGVLDFAFSGISNNYVDISRIIGRTNKDFAKVMLQAFEDMHKTKIDSTYIDELVKMWNYVEEQYIVYIKQNHPEIVLPD